MERSSADLYQSPSWSSDYAKDQVIAKGAHLQYGEAHAERNAIANCSSSEELIHSTVLLQSLKINTRFIILLVLKLIFPFKTLISVDTETRKEGTLFGFSVCTEIQGIIGNPSLNHRYRKGFYSLFKTLQQNLTF